MNDTTRPDHRLIFEMAAEKGGYFTTAEANRAGISNSLIFYYAKHGDYIRVARGIYRLRDFPSSPSDELHAALMAMAPDGVVSHESALALHGLSDVIPDSIHITIPRAQRRPARIDGVTVHTATESIPANDISIVDGIQVTSVPRTIADAADAGVAPEQIVTAVRQAVRRGLATSAEIHAAATRAGSRVADLVQVGLPGPATTRYRSAEAFRQALETRLLRARTETGRSMTRLRKEVSFDRLLARLFSVAPDRWVLKGGLALDYRYGDRARSTKDLDLDTTGAEAQALRDLLDAAKVDLEDYFIFSIERTELEDPDQETGMRFHVKASVAGRLFDSFVIDVGVGRHLDAEIVEGPALLDFAGLAPVSAPAIPLEAQLAEKLHAYSRRYGRSDMHSTRVKDLADTNLISRESSVDARKLRLEIEETFARRATHEMPGALPAPPSSWSSPYARLAEELGLAKDLDAAHRDAADFINPVLANPAIRGRWDQERRKWVV